jgi:hypothetical protein
MTRELGRHDRLTIWKPWVTYTGTDPRHVAWRVKLTETLNWESLFIPSWLSLRRSTKSSTGENPQGKRREGETAVERQPPQAPFLARQISKWFYDTSTGTATRAARCGSFISEGLSRLGSSYGWTWWTPRFTWFRPPEHNTLRPWGRWLLYYCVFAQVLVELAQIESSKSLSGFSGCPVIL